MFHSAGSRRSCWRRITECAQRKNLRRKIEVPPKTRNRREHGLRQSGGKAESTLRGGRNRCQSRTTPAPMSEDQNQKGAPLMDTGTMNGASVSSFVPTPVFTARVSLPACLTRGAESRRAGSGRALGYPTRMQEHGIVVVCFKQRGMCVACHHCCCELQTRHLARRRVSGKCDRTSTSRSWMPQNEPRKGYSWSCREAYVWHGSHQGGC